MGSDKLGRFLRHSVERRHVFCCELSDHKSQILEPLRARSTQTRLLIQIGIATRRENGRETERKFVWRIADNMRQSIVPA